MSVKNHWYCRVDGQQYGPYTWEQMRGMADEGRLIAESYVRRQVDQRWLTAAQVPGLLAKKTTPPAPPGSKPRASSKSASAPPKSAVASAPEPPPIAAPPPVAAPPAAATAEAPPALALNIQVQPPPLTKSGVVKAPPAVTARPTPAAPAPPPKAGAKAGGSKNNQALLVGGLLASGVVLLTATAVGLFIWKSLPPREVAAVPAPKTAAQLADEKAAAERAAIDRARELAAIDAQLAALEAADGKTRPAQLPTQLPATPTEAAPPPAADKSVASADVKATPPAGGGASEKSLAAPPPPTPTAAQVTAAAKVIGSVKKWVDVSRAPRIGLLKMQLQVGSVWLAADATGKRIEPPAPAEPAAAAESGDAAGGAAPPEEAAPPADAAAPVAPAVPAKFVFVELRVTNGDTVPHSYASWNSLAGTSAILADGNGQPLEFVPPAATPGVTRHNLVELAPGQTVTDVLVFAAPQGPPGKLKLALANTALLGNVKSSGSTHLGLEIPPDYLLSPPETTVGIEAGAAPAPPAAAAPAAEGDAPPPLANAPPAKPRDPSAPPTLDDFTKDLERQELMKKKEGQGGEFEDLKVPPTAPKKPLPGKAGEKAP